MFDEADEEHVVSPRRPDRGAHVQAAGLTLSGTEVLSFDTVFAAASAATEIAYEVAPTSGFEKRLLSQEGGTSQERPERALKNLSCCESPHQQGRIIAT
ncbi:MAG: hypothetical protein U0359_35990 [Byssovorax sp.]